MFFKNVDWWIFLPILALLALGSFGLSGVGSTARPQQFFYPVAAGIIFILFSNFDLRFFRRISHVLYTAAILLLVATIVFATEVRGATRWLSFGPVFFQPSEIVKPVLVFFWAQMVVGAGSLRRLFLAVLTFALAFVLVFLQPDLGTSMVFLAGFFGVLFTGAAIPGWFFVAAGVSAIAASPLGWQVLADYQKQRIFSFLSPATDPLGMNYNSIQSVIAVGSGGLAGRGLGQGTQSQLAFLPERHTDFIFAAVSEELGFFSSLVVLIAFGALLLRIVYLIKEAEDDGFSKAFLGGSFFILFSHVVINIGMNMGLLPIAGVPLPFVSSGGSALVSFSVMLGMVSGVGSKLKKRGGLGILSSSS